MSDKNSPRLGLPVGKLRTEKTVCGSIHQGFEKQKKCHGYSKIQKYYIPTHGIQSIQMVPESFQSVVNSVTREAVKYRK